MPDKLILETLSFNWKGGRVMGGSGRNKGQRSGHFMFTYRSIVENPLSISIFLAENQLCNTHETNGVYTEAPSNFEGSPPASLDLRSGACSAGGHVLLLRPLIVVVFARRGPVIWRILSYFTSAVTHIRPRVVMDITRRLLHIAPSM
ncbi:hypothetical protein EVAR_84520_1 [Eumeta japonica]|uniref:Uncharacterized protein n=1 Tax=Eumeta variegata TaxID=151549 RepID=A0A4C1UHM8_EUMVA|nr:hypothetical protein EVAR_84520_1 [Eumeta japonica]